MFLIYAVLGLTALLLVRALLQERMPERRRVLMNFREVNDPAVLRAAALTNTSHRHHEPTEF